MHEVFTVGELSIPSLRPDRLATALPTTVYCGGPLTDPAHTLVVWRSCKPPADPRGATLAFFVEDNRFPALWNNPHGYADKFLRQRWGALIEPDFSLWCDAPLIEQLWSTYRMRTLGRLWQDAGVSVIPNLAWSDERSFAFCFFGIPQHPPLVACECRTPGSNDDDRRAFLRGLAEGVRQIRPQHVLVYGGSEHRYWLTGNLPPGPQYSLLESFTHKRDTARARHARALQHRHQFVFNFNAPLHQGV